MKRLFVVLIIGSIVAPAVTALGASTSNPNLQWPMFGQNYANTASNSFEKKINTQNVTSLAPKWVATTGGDVSARAALVNGVVYFPDWGGNLWALDAQTGDKIWQHQFSDYGLPAETVSRTSPAAQRNTIYVGTQLGAYELAINAADGSLLWKTQLDPHPLAIITSSAAVLNNVVYTGVASLEEGMAVDPNYPCCSFRGSAVAVNATTGKILWKTYMAPPGYTGSSVWGSSPVLDASRNTVFVGTGNNYSTPTGPAYRACIARGDTQRSCLSADDHVDSVVALNMGSGAIKWAHRLSNGDDWNGACIFADTNCPSPAGPDYDFGSGLNEFTVRLQKGTGSATTKTNIIGAGQKSGIYSAFDPDTGNLLWATLVGPGSSLGGMEWGSATDGKRIYVAIANSYGIPYAAGRAGSWSALDPTTGSILWQTPDPKGTIDIGPVTAVNGIVYADSMAGGAKDQNMFALDAATGKILWSYAAGASVNAGAVVSDGVVYWGSGYAHLGTPGSTGQKKFYAFSLEGQ
jgi:polyvinyl alcohol dehydrogenase (cytochrome)